MTPYSGVALIVGAGSADGRAVSKALILAGCTRLVLAHEDESTLRDTESQCRGLMAQQTHGSTTEVELLVLKCDLKSEQGVEALIAAAFARFGAVDYCANCLRPTQLGIDGPGGGGGGGGVAEAVVTEGSRDASPFKGGAYSWQRAVWLCVRGEIAHILKHRTTQTTTNTAQQPPPSHPASIVNISAVHGLASEGGDIESFVAAAHAIVGLTRATALDYIKHDIRLNCVCPGNDDSITADDVAAAVVFLLGEQARSINGVALPVDGGWSLYHR